MHHSHTQSKKHDFALHCRRHERYWLSSPTVEHSNENTMQNRDKQDLSNFNLTIALNGVPVECLAAGGALVRLLVGVDDLVAAERRRLPEPLPAHLADEGART